MRLRAQRVSALTLSVLILSSAVVGVGLLSALVAGQSNTYEKTFENVGDTRFVGMDSEGWSGATVTVEISTSDGPGGQNVTLYRENWTTARLNKKSTVTVFENAGAYDSITVRVEGAPSEPEWGVGSEFGNLDWDPSDRFGSTGGDRNLTPELMERISMTTNPNVNIVDVSGVPGATSVDEDSLSELDANDTKLELYESAGGSSDTAANFHAVSNNFLQDAETVALIKGKNAAIRSMNTDGSQTKAEAAGKENVSEFYSSQERNFLAQWNSQMAEAEYLQGLAKDETGVDPLYVHGSWTLHDSNGWEVVNSTILGFASTNYTLRNGTNAEATTVDVEIVIRDTANDNYYIYSATFGPTTGDKTAAPTVGFGASTSDNGAATVEGIAINPPDSNYDELEFVDFSEYSGDFSSVKSQNSNAQDQIVTVVNQTYDQYQAGEINNSELVDPYTLQNQYSPGSEYEGWAAATLANLGTNQPTDFDQIGYMNVTLEDGTKLRGVLHSQSNPPSGSFAVGETYNASNISGQQYIVTESSTREIQQNFTLNSATNQSGGNMTQVTIVEKNYTTTSAADLSALYDQLALMRAEIDARQDAIGDNGGGALAGLPAWKNLDPTEKAVAAGGGGIGLVAVGRLLLGS